MLEDRILEMAENISWTPGVFELWAMPKITGLNGVAGSGKMTWVINNYTEGGLIISKTVDAKNLKENLAPTQEEQ